MHAHGNRTFILADVELVLGVVIVAHTLKIPVRAPFVGIDHYVPLTEPAHRAGKILQRPTAGR